MISRTYDNVFVLPAIHARQHPIQPAAHAVSLPVDADDPLLLVQAMRHVTDGDLLPEEATCFYHEALARSGLRAERPLGADRCITENMLLAAPAGMSTVS
ncbi:acetyl-CoA synthetase [Komagataeibacter europaeus NBRC 3261]|uniref:Acetyl-CoA synthetase n=1 Tax=Komagataeibacter europaeus NBRC 3261 TaxID=1234669 RepID=A0A0D6Q181_KOMEU|nr:hypothetical protein [Komagataeibacter europaeus]GAN96536.1 acetyl-CoA synthetase [Komagataeibacter europaeus NBRC 3261]